MSGSGDTATATSAPTTVFDDSVDLLGLGMGDEAGGVGNPSQTQQQPPPPMELPPPPPEEPQHGFLFSRSVDDSPPSSPPSQPPADDRDLDDLLSGNASSGRDEGDDTLLDLNDKPPAEAGAVGLSGNAGMFGHTMRSSGRGHSPEPSRIGEITVTDTEENAGSGDGGRRGLFGWGSKKNVSSASSSSGGFFRRNPSASSFSDDPRQEGSADFAAASGGGFRDGGTAEGEGGITGDDDLARDLTPAEIDDAITAVEEDAKDQDDELRPGDHVYVWQGYGINPRAYQRHAIVATVTRKDQPGDIPLTDEEKQHLSFDTMDLYTHTEDQPAWDGNYLDNGPIQVEVVSFYHFSRGAATGPNRKGKRFGCKKELLHNFIGADGVKRKKLVRKVRYGRQVKRGLLSTKAAVGTALKRDEVGLILARLAYLLEHPEHLPEHHALAANGECAALWCVTGRWCTLQGANILQITGIGQAGGALLAGGILSNISILAPMPGVWGMAGWWWYVPATVAYPFLVPMLVAFGMCSLVPLEILRRNRKKWRAITDGLSHEFWSNADDDVRDEFFGAMATAERKAELRSFFGVREGDDGAEDSKYMPLGGAPGGPGGDDSDEDDDEEAEAKAVMEMEKSCQSMAKGMDLSGKPPPVEGGGKGVWGNIVGSFRRGGSSGAGSGRNEESEERKGIVS